MRQKDRPSSIMSPFELSEAMGELLTASTLPEFTSEQWQALIRFSGDVMIVAQLQHWLASRGLLAQLDDEICAYLQEVHALNAARVDQLVKTFHRCAQALNEAGVEPVALKGLALLVGSGPTHALFESRITYDVDALISVDSLAPSLASLKSHGYRQLSHYNVKEMPSGDSLDNFGEIDLLDFRNSIEFARAHVPPFLDTESVCSIDLHTAVLSSDSPVAESLTTLMVEQSTQVTDADNGTRYRVPDPAPQMILAVYHSQIKNRYHYLGQIDWRLLMDFSAMLELHPDTTFVEEIMQLSQSIGIDAEMYTVMVQLNRYVGLDIELHALDSPARSRSYKWFKRRQRWTWLAKTCHLMLVVQKSIHLVSPHELHHALGGRPNFSNLMAHLTYRLKRSLKS